MEAHVPVTFKTVDEVLKADLWARREAEKIIADFGLRIAD
jgi:hypothetical protein